MAPLVLLHALLWTSAAAAVAMENTTGDGTTTSPVGCNGGECDPPGKPLPIYGYPPAPWQPPALPTQPSAAGSHTPLCPPTTVVCCGGGGAGGQNVPQQPSYYGPPTGGYVPYYNASASPHGLLAPSTLVGYCGIVACIFLAWFVV
ncbi:hypothetical protein HU200_058219 [Digitaria exilis]|uniref:Uncharacterized protein n=1 Tax=Digitaria exilis TaxID=1010633 RepID=A0A835AG11_9POAL|nr:hypothetical protein HU200_058219 [Digitaria exilis]